MMADSMQPVDLSPLVGPFTADELMAAIARHPALSYSGKPPPEHGATFDALTVRKTDNQLYVLTYNRQPDGRWLMDYGAI
jgi:hypothetical protein